MYPLLVLDSYYFLFYKEYAHVKKVGLMMLRNFLMGTLILIFSSFVIANGGSEEQEMVTISKEESSLIELYNSQAINSEQYNNLLSMGVKDDDVLATTKRRDGQKLVQQSRSTTNTAPPTPHLPQDGDTITYKWESERNGKIYGHKRTEEYQESGGSGGWYVIFYSETFLRDAPEDDEDDSRDPE
ncbi:hypothetical protein [Idiomarina seosinensis]|uniref:Uncharacterized protein n=1 Tax=Idiomarina seosinensis TaxID=281739 RepID=A0A432ZHB4_9GAMM|nr:hypothetical protein [Idiomarina seosinensis]RUO77319.1 hypothetical protein CWI81_02215 [Idiomarina seosinensis]